MSLKKFKELEENKNVNDDFSEKELRELRTLAEIISNIIIKEIENEDYEKR